MQRCPCAAQRDKSGELACSYQLGVQMHWDMMYLNSGSVFCRLSRLLLERSM